MLDDIKAKLDEWMQIKDYKLHRKEETRKHKSIDAFISTFTANKISSMEIDDYVIGKRNTKSFCYWIEQRLEGYGSISGRTTALLNMLFTGIKGKISILLGRKFEGKTRIRINN